MPEPYLVSIITPSFNQGHFIEQTIQSVVNQTYPHIEFIVIDGASTDQTLDIIQQYDEHITYWESRPDSGQSEAINRGFSLATGHIMAWLNSDDLYLEHTVQHVVDYFTAHPDCYFLYGNVISITDQNRSFGRRTHVRPATFEDLVHKGDYIVQPAAFWRAEVYQQVGGLDLNLHYTLDYEYWMRIAQRYPLCYTHEILAYERIYAHTKTVMGGIKRVRELATVPTAFSGEGIPKVFRPEAAAVILLEGLSYIKKRDYQKARELIYEGLSMKCNRVKMLIYVLSLGLLGEKGTIFLRLVSNKIKSTFQRGMYDKNSRYSD